MPVPARMSMLACHQRHVALDPAAPLLKVVLQVTCCLQETIPVTQRANSQILLQQSSHDACQIATLFPACGAVVLDL